MNQTNKGKNVTPIRGRGFGKRASMIEALKECVMQKQRQRVAFWEVAEQKPLVGGSVTLSYLDGDRTVDAIFPVHIHHIQLLIESYDRILSEDINGLRDKIKELESK